MMRIERIDDLGLLIGVIRQSGLAEVLDRHYPVHGNWRGPSLGKIVSGWLGYVLSEADHRLSHVEDWASARLETLRLLLDAPDLESSHFRDQHLEVILDRFSEGDSWDSMLIDHMSGLLQVYPLGSEVVRLDAMITQSYREIGGLFQVGHSKQHIAGLPQMKEMMAVSDGYGLPLMTQIVSGERADDQLYLPMVAQIRKMIAPSGLLYVGDSKMSSQGTRATLQAQGNGYLMPLSLRQLSVAQREEALAAAPPRAQMQQVRAEADPATGQPGELKAYGFTQQREMSAADETGALVQWQEQLVYVCSLAHQEAQLRHLEARLTQAGTDIDALLTRKRGKKVFRQRAELDEAIAKVLQRHRVEGLLRVEVEQQTQARVIPAKGQKPAREEITHSFSLRHQRDEAAIEAHSQLIGWQVYATNQLEMTFEQAVIIYRKQYRIEHRFDQLLNRVLHLLPLYLQLEHRICALIRLLTLALQFSAIIEHQVRTSLEQNPQIADLKGLYPGHKGRATRNPTTAMILMAFRNIFLVFDPEKPEHERVQLSGFNQQHHQLMQLANIGLDKYYLASRHQQTA